MDHRPPGLSLHLPTSILRRSSLHPVPHACFYCRVPSPFAPPCRPGPVSRSLLVPWVFSAVSPSMSLFPRLSPSPCESSSLFIFWCLVLFSSGGLFCVQRQQARRLHSLAVVCPSPRPPLLNGASGAVQANWVTPHIPSPPPPMYY